MFKGFFKEAKVKPKPDKNKNRFTPTPAKMEKGHKNLWSELKK